MTESTKTILIVGGVAIVGYFLYQKLTRPNAQAKAPQTNVGTGNSVPAQTNNGSSGSTSWWNNLGAVVNGASAAVTGAEKGLNSVYDFFGGGSSTSPASSASGG